jgi:hypothetical protein
MFLSSYQQVGTFSFIIIFFYLTVNRLALLAYYSIINWVPRLLILSILLQTCEHWAMHPSTLVLLMMSWISLCMPVTLAIPYFLIRFAGCLIHVKITRGTCKLTRTSRTIKNKKIIVKYLNISIQLLRAH